VFFFFISKYIEYKSTFGRIMSKMLDDACIFTCFTVVALFLRSVSLCSPGYPGTSFVDQFSLVLRDLLASEIYPVVVFGLLTQWRNGTPVLQKGSPPNDTVVQPSGL